MRPPDGQELLLLRPEDNNLRAAWRSNARWALQEWWSNARWANIALGANSVTRTLSEALPLDSWEGHPRCAHLPVRDYSQTIPKLLATKEFNLGNAFARRYCCRRGMVCCLLPSMKLPAERSLGNAFARLRCCRRCKVCCLLPVKKLGARKQPWTLIGDRQKTRYKSFP